MNREKNEVALAGIEPVQRRIESWRQQRLPGSAMPEELWSAAAELAARHSVYAVSRRLGLKFDKLKRHLEQRHPDKIVNRRAPKRGEPGGRTGLEAGSFLELNAAQLFGQSPAELEAVLELVAPDGARMRVSLRGQTAVDLPALVHAFGRRAERCCR